MTLESQNNNSSRLTDEVLISEAKSGNSKSADILLKRYYPFVRAISVRYTGASLETDDIVQEGLLGLLSAIYSYSPGKSAAFRTYCAVCVHNRIISFLKQNEGVKNKPLNNYISFEDIDIPDTDDPESIIISEYGVDKINELISETLSEREKSVLILHIEGNSYKAAAMKLGISEKAVDNAIQRIRTKLIRLLNEN